MIIKNINDLNRAIQPYIIRAMEMTENKIFDVISAKVNDYYDEYEPKDYHRTGTLKESLTASPIQSDNGLFSFTVGFDDDYLTFQYPGWPTVYGRATGGVNPATGHDVLSLYFNNKLHGAPPIPGKHRFWDEAIAELGGENGIIQLFKENLKKVGLPIV